MGNQLSMSSYLRWDKVMEIIRPSFLLKLGVLTLLSLAEFEG